MSFMGRNWAYKNLDVVQRMRGSQSMFHCERIRRKKALENGGASSHIRPTCNLIEI